MLGCLDLLYCGGHIRARAAVDNPHLLGAQPEGGASSVHGHIAAADHGHDFAFYVRRLTQVDLPQENDARKYAFQVFSRHPHRLVAVGTDGQEESGVLLL